MTDCKGAGPESAATDSESPEERRQWKVPFF